ncbi:cellulose binding domain-containing protein [Nonomuraea endophytica]|uniref:Hydrolase n=1 Tax=Nonomuraea endophytica TaxID=714136 RepID=A0A7W8A413_9ACTN|nr:cellulose binding domain-containing protein [Nonomuraea endophytica]MBB5079124.1 hypothetical protein [Nonomuraea endophytica]
MMKHLLVAMAVLGTLAVPAQATAAPAVRLQYYTTAPQPAAPQAEPIFNLVNSGTTTLQLRDLKIRYYFTGSGPHVFACSWARVGCSQVTGTFGNGHLELGFRGGTLGAGAQTQVEVRFYRADWQSFSQSDDYSFGAVSAYTDWPKATVHRSGTLMWGDPPPTSGPAGVLFDDFAYTNADDPLIAARNWTVRTNPGGPGVPGATWPKGNVTFPTADGAKVMQLKATNDGVNITQSEMLHQRKFFEGTYAARVKFSDAPTTGADGDETVQTFFTITPLDAPMDPNYGELDFEYLPNGGWGLTGPLMYMTSWETYQPDPWLADNTSTFVNSSHAGWHDLVVQVSGGTLRYYVDGRLAAEHGGKYYPETPMSINFNHWFITAGQTGTARTWIQQVDWVYHSKNEVVSPAEVSSRVAGYRAGNVTWQDTI